MVGLAGAGALAALLVNRGSSPDAIARDPGDVEAAAGALSTSTAEPATRDLVQRASAETYPGVARQRPRQPTPLGEIEIALVLAEGHELAFGEPPTDLRLGIAWAHVSLEHRRGADIENHNFGNMSVNEHDPGDFFVRVLRERKRAHYDAEFGRWRWYETRLRAFPSATEGARAYWRHLFDHYNKALQLFSVGDGRDAGRKLARDGYATTYPEPYTESIGDLAGEFKLRILPELQRLRRGEGTETIQRAPTPAPAPPSAD